MEVDDRNEVPLMEFDLPQVQVPLKNLMDFMSSSSCSDN